MSKSKKNPTPGELISEEQLDAVAGGGGTGSLEDPYHDNRCWFLWDGAEREDGRRKCMTECKGKFKGNQGVGLFDKSGKWYICACWGTNFCIGKWHMPCGKDPRDDST